MSVNETMNKYLNEESKVKLKKVHAGSYAAEIAGNEFIISSPEPGYQSDPGFEWSVESPDLEVEEYFRTLKDVREYLNSLKDQLE